LIFKQIETINTNVREGFSGTFTSLESLMVSACDLSNVYEDFNQTWTVLENIETKINDGFSGTFTSLEALVVGACDLTQVYEDFRQTWTVLDNVNCDLSEVYEDFNQTWTVLEEIRQQVHNATAVYDSMVAGDTIATSAIGGSGRYQLIENITKKIVIDTDDVDLNLAQHTISQTDATEDIITVESDQTRVAVYNGTIVSSNGPGTGTGITVKDGTSAISIESIKVHTCGVGILLDGTSDNEVTECCVSDCDLIGSTTGMQLLYADENVVQHCTATSNKQAGFSLLHSEGNYFNHCQALKTSGNNTTVVGFLSESGDSNSFENCVVKKTTSSATAFASKVCGFLLTGTETKTEIVESTAQKTNASASGDTVSYGVALYPTISLDISTPVACSTAATSTLLGIHWSATEDYVATVDASQEVQVLKFDGTNVSFLHNVSFTTPKAVNWSPDGKQLAIGTGTTTEVYEFNGFVISINSSYPGPGTQVTALEWTPNGAHLAIGYNSGTSPLRVIGFTGTALVDVAVDASMSVINDISWSPSGNYFACVGQDADSNQEVAVFSFDGTQISFIDDYPVLSSMPVSVAWSANGNYIAFGETNGDVEVLSFNGSILANAAITSGPGTPSGADVSWSPCGRYLVVGYPGGSSGLHVYSFTGSTLPSAATNITTSNSYHVSWSPSGKYIATAKSSEDNFICVYDAMTIPEQCLLEDNTVNNNSATGQVAGIGILAGGKNMFAENISGYNTRNYSYGVANVYWGWHNFRKPFDSISLPAFQ